MAQEFTRWYVQSCPLSAECSKSAWDRQKYCESLVSEKATRANLLRHLTGSGLHNHNDADTLETTANVLCGVETEAVSGHWWATKHATEMAAQHESDFHESTATKAPQPCNLLRRPRSPPKRDSKRRGIEISNHSNEDRIIDLATKAAVTAAAVIMSGPNRCALGDESDESSSLKIRKVDMLIHAVRRASQAAGKAAHICEQARIAFESEQNNLDAALQDIERTA